MRLDFVWDYGVTADTCLKFDPEVVAMQVVQAVLRTELMSMDYQIELVVTDDETIRRVNRENREIDAVTDVLSFPMLIFSSPAVIDEEHSDTMMDPESGLIFLGDIMIALPRMLQQASEYGHDDKREFAFLVAHSMLHLLGYDHMIKKDADVMEAKQEAILQQLKIRR